MEKFYRAVYSEHSLHVPPDVKGRSHYTVGLLAPGVRQLGTVSRDMDKEMILWTMSDRNANVIACSGVDGRGINLTFASKRYTLFFVPEERLKDSSGEIPFPVF